jgi:hypothetical protein
MNGEEPSIPRMRRMEFSPPSRRFSWKFSNSLSILCSVTVALIFLSFQQSKQIRPNALEQTVAPLNIDSIAVEAPTPEAAAISAVSTNGISAPKVDNVDCPGGVCSGIADGFVKDVKSFAGHLIKSFIAPSNVIPVQWRQTNDQDGPGYEGSTAFQLPNIVGPGKSVNPVQINAKIVFPKPESKAKPVRNPCQPTSSTDPCESAQPRLFSEKDMQVRLQALRRRADERLGDARRNWEETVLTTKQRFRERMQGLQQRADALANQIRELEAGGGARLDLPEYVRVRNRVAGALLSATTFPAPAANDPVASHADGKRTRARFPLDPAAPRRVCRDHSHKGARAPALFLPPGYV